jgi:hypothetical protein
VYFQTNYRFKIFMIDGIHNSIYPTNLDSEDIKVDA